MIKGKELNCPSGENTQYDILFCASTFKTPNLALKFLKSIINVKGRHLAVLVSPLLEDITELASNLKDITTDVILFHSDIDNQCLGRAWGFVW
ncbi:MAG: hypothetical protein ACK42Z_09855, partial [Candidatus Kapaibacteriota bacterium]